METVFTVGQLNYQDGSWQGHMAGNFSTINFTEQNQDRTGGNGGGSSNAGSSGNEFKAYPEIGHPGYGEESLKGYLHVHPVNHYSY